MVWKRYKKDSWIKGDLLLTIDNMTPVWSNEPPVWCVSVIKKGADKSKLHKCFDMKKQAIEYAKKYMGK